MNKKTEQNKEKHIVKFSGRISIYFTPEQAEWIEKKAEETLGGLSGGKLIKSLITETLQNKFADDQNNPFLKTKK